MEKIETEELNCDVVGSTLFKLYFFVILFIISSIRVGS